MSLPVVVQKNLLSGGEEGNKREENMYATFRNIFSLFISFCI